MSYSRIGNTRRPGQAARAKLLMIEGMGHALPIRMWPQLIDAIAVHANGAAAKAA